MLTLGDLDVILGLEEILSSISDEHAEASAKRHLSPPAPGETVIGELSSNTARRLWVASYAGALRARKMQSEAELELGDAESARLKEEADRQQTYSDAARELFFLQLKHEVNGWNVPGLGIRAGWKIVKVASPGESILHRLFGVE